MSNISSSSLDKLIESKTSNIVSKSNVKKNYALISLKKNWELYLFILPVLAYFIIFHYVPMYGVQIAFKKFVATKGIWGSEWVGFTHFIRFFNSYYFTRLIGNTLGISLYQLIAGFPIPILLALMINEVRNHPFKKTVQLVTYAPHFLSTVVICGMIISFLSPSYGIVNEFLKLIGLQPIYFMSKPEWFKSLYVWSGIWQNAGWASIIYIAALSGIDTQLYEAAVVDGANKFQKIWNITIPGILPTAIIMLILDMGRVMNVGFEKIFLLQNSMIMDTSDVISTYVYRTGLLDARYDIATAIGFFNAVINLTMLILVNKLAKKINQTSLW